MTASRKVRISIAIATVVTLSACGSGSDDDDSGSPSSVTPIATETSDMAVLTDAPVLSTMDNEFFQTGFVLTEIRTEVLINGAMTIDNFETDTQTNTITNDALFGLFADVVYDEQGVVNTINFGLSNDLDLLYNDDGTLARTERQIGDFRLDFVDYEYDAGNIIARREGSVEDGESSISASQIYDYSPGNTMVTVREFIGDSSEPDSSIELGLDNNGNVVDFTFVSATTGGVVSTLAAFYDDNSNLVRVETFDGDGDLLTIVEYIYEPSAEPTPNYITLFSGLTSSRLPTFDFVALTN